MFNISSRILKLPRDISALKGIASISSTTKLLALNSNNVTQGNYKFNDKPDYNSHNCSYKYLCYVVLFGTTSYAAYKFW